MAGLAAMSNLTQTCRGLKRSQCLVVASFLVCASIGIGLILLTSYRPSASQTRGGQLRLMSQLGEKELARRRADSPHIPAFLKGIPLSERGWPTTDLLDSSDFEFPMETNILGRWIRADLCAGVEIEMPDYVSEATPEIEFFADGRVAFGRDDQDSYPEYYKLFYSLDYGGYALYTGPYPDLKVWDPRLLIILEITDIPRVSDRYGKVLTGLYAGTFGRAVYIRSESAHGGIGTRPRN
jgi:hypothetical protein